MTDPILFCGLSIFFSSRSNFLPPSWYVTFVFPIFLVTLGLIHQSVHQCPLHTELINILQYYIKFSLFECGPIFSLNYISLVFHFSRVWLQCSTLMLIESAKDSLSFSVTHYKHPKQPHTVQVSEGDLSTNRTVPQWLINGNSDMVGER